MLFYFILGIGCFIGLISLMMLQFLLLPKEDQEAIQKHLENGGSIFDGDDFF